MTVKRSSSARFARKNFRALPESVGMAEEAPRKRVFPRPGKAPGLSRSGVSISETPLIAALATGAAVGAPPHSL
jgi:hypothetical protein